jgi:hypothetical protein
MKCSATRAFLSQISDRQESIAPVSSTDLDYLTTNGYLLRTSNEDHDKGVSEVAKLTQMVTQVQAASVAEEQAKAALGQDEQKEHSFLFHFEGREEKTELQGRIEDETAVLTREESELKSMETNVNSLIQEKSMIDRMVRYDGGYLSLTGLGTVILNDLNVRNYRVADQEFPDFLTEIKATYAELRSIADRAASCVNLASAGHSESDDDDQGDSSGGSRSLLWGTAIGVAKLQGDAGQIGERFATAVNDLQRFDSTLPNKLMAAEVLTALGNQGLQNLESVLTDLDKQLRHLGVPKELSVGVAATIIAGRRFDGTYPTDRFTQFRGLTQSYEAAAILAVMNVPTDELTSKFQAFRSMFVSWGYMASEDTEISSAFLAIGELAVNEVQDKLKYIVEQLRNYLEYPLVAAAILASIPVFEAHEVLDLMEKAVTLLSAYAAGLERSELVALAVRMIHGVRNELVREIDPTARIAQTPIQFTYSPHPGLFIWYHPVIVAYSAYHATFSGMGGFHPAHSHGVGGFAG